MNEIMSLESLKCHLDKTWEELFHHSRFLRFVKEGKTTKFLYAMYLLETYHYTYHNARNQALVGTRKEELDFQYQKFCFQHAAEETGHEQMALNDLKNLGLYNEGVEIPPPLPQTTVLIAYLYWISQHGNPVQRLGYSYWAESCYEYIMPLMDQVTRSLGLTRAQTTFLVAHAEIDKEHSRQVQHMINRVCKTTRDWQDVTEVMETSLKLTGNMMDSIYDQYLEFENHSSDRYSFLRSLVA